MGRLLFGILFVGICGVSCNQISGLGEYDKGGVQGTDDSSSSGNDLDSGTDDVVEPICELPCAPEMLGNGTCDDVCKNTSCGYDNGDCYNDECVPGCIINDIGDGVCNEPCNVDTCEFDKGDCGSTGTTGCTPGCEDWMVGDGACQYQCLGPTCGNDGGDCDDQDECSPGCGNVMLGDGICHAECNYTQCFNDNGDCGGGTVGEGCDPGATSCQEGCVPCAEDSTCLNAVSICNGNNECVALKGCIWDCEDRFVDLVKEQCISTCETDHVAGQYDYTEAKICLYCHACPVSCASDAGDFCLENGY